MSSSSTITIKNGDCWKDIFLSRNNIYARNNIIGHLKTRKDLAGFPFVILSDHIPQDEELLQLLTQDQLYCREMRPLIIALYGTDGPDQGVCWRLLEMGIADIVQWEEETELIHFLESVYQRNKEIRDVLDSPLVTENLVGASSTWRKFLTGVIEATLYSEASILLIGPSGTGKELISRLVHTLDTRPDKKKLIIVDCTTIAPELSGSELFGHERGSYTNAIQGREGAVALANGGTLFLDEVGELPPALQAELLRVLQEGTYKKIGSNTWQKSRFRLVCATNKDLRKAVEEGHFRQDLYFRIADC